MYLMTVFNNHSLIKMYIGQSDGYLKKIITRRKLDDLNEIKLKISQVNFNYRQIDINVKYDKFITDLTNIIDDLTPKLEIVIRGDNKPWFNVDILNIIKLRDSKFRRFKFTKDEHDLAEYKLERNRVVDMIRRSKYRYYEQCIDENKNDSKSMWKILKSITCSNQAETFAEVHFDDKISRDEKIICTEFNKYYIDSICKILDTISVSNDVRIASKIPDCSVGFELNASN